MGRYSLGIPYVQANSPARDLCDDCIIRLSPDEFKALDFSKPRQDLPVETKGAGAVLGDFTL